MGKLQGICWVVNRRRILDTERPGTDSLRRCLNCWDLASMSVGSTLGVGVYVLVGAVALKIAGPSILLSFLMAAITALFAGLCYAEFGARVPLAGSAFIYTYVSVGELAAFVVGWNNVLEFVFGAASVARGLSLYVDSTVNKTMSDWFVETMPMGVYGLSPFFDLFAFLFTLALGGLLTIGVRSSTTVNNVFSVGNILVIIFIVALGAFKANPDNWSIPASEVPPGRGEGGFFPYGVWGTLKGAAVCFYGFVGFDVINFSGEEVRSPRRTIPLAILSSLLIVFGAYAGVSVVVTMMVPYYQLDGVASVATVFSDVGWEWARWVVTAGAVCGIFTSLFGSLYPVPRLLYSMAHDGLFLHWFGKTNDRSQSPVVATVVPTMLIAVLAAILELEELVLMTCIGTLLSFTIVAACVILLRHRSEYMPETPPSYVKQMFGFGNKLASRNSSTVVVATLAIYLCLCICMAAVNIHSAKPLVPGLVLHGLAILAVAVMALQPAVEEKLDFRTPFVPFIPCLSIYANIHLMAIINWETWIRVLIWVLIGIPIYIICLCCYRQSMAAGSNDVKNQPYIHKNAKSITVQIVVESPTPPGTIALTSNPGEQQNIEKDETQKRDIQEKTIRHKEEIVVHKVMVEYNEEKEAKIIDLLDQVLQAEEDSYGDVVSLKENNDNVEGNETEAVIYRKSLSELSDAGSDASLGNQVLSKYDVIAQVHREDLPKLYEVEERVDISNDILLDDYEEVTAFNDSETNSRTDESGYSDTIDRTPLNGSMEDTKETFHIPVPPPMDENYFNTPHYEKYNTIPAKRTRIETGDEDGEIPVPPPMDENYFNTPHYKKFNTIAAKHAAVETGDEDDEVKKPRESIQSNISNGSYGDNNMRFGSDRQKKFMNKLNDIFQNKITSNEEEEPRKRSQSTGNVPDLELSVSRERPAIFLDLKKELLSRETADNLRPVETEQKVLVPEEEGTEEAEFEDVSMSREDLKSKLENIFAAGGPKLLKPRLMKSNPPTPEDSYQTDTQSSTESIPKLPKIEKNDTLNRQKAKFGQVLNSFRISMNKDDDV